MGGWVGAVCTLLVWMSFGSFSLRELTCMYCVSLALLTARFCLEVFYVSCIHFHLFIHSGEPVWSSGKALGWQADDFGLITRFGSFLSLKSETERSPELSCRINTQGS